MTNTSTYRARVASAVAAMLIAAALVGCGTDLPTNNPTDVGMVAVFVSDQNGNGVPNAEVFVTVPGPGGNFTDDQPTLTTIGEVGNVTFSDVPAGTSQIWVNPPTGYTGGGVANEKTITITTNQTTEVELSLTKSSS